jgi:acetylornithine deacetylase/succinyl-diaminopimelate desuccinylase-like protein
LTRQDNPTLPVHNHIDQHFDAHLARTQKLLAQKSVTTEGVGIAKMAEVLVEELSELGADARVCPTEGNPVVYGELDSGADRTLLIYGMYDTMPFDPDEWISHPLAAEVVDLDDVGPSIVARGAVNQKGPLASCLNMLHSWRSVHGEFPVNLKFVIEGEEELCSPSLPEFVESHRDLLACDGMVFPALIQNRAGTPEIRLGCKGILFLYLRVRGGEWGGPVKNPAHSATAAWFHSPAFVMVQALASMISADQRRVLIRGFYDNIAPVPEEDQPMLDQLLRTFDPYESLTSYGVERFKWDSGRLELLRKYLYEPSLNIAGLLSGDNGPDAVTILPHEAYARIGIRFVPDQQADSLLQLVKEHLRDAGFPQVEVEKYDTTHWSYTSVNSLPAQAAIKACREMGFEPQVWPRIAGAAPFSLFTETLGMPMCIAGLGHGGGAHIPNEYATVEGLRLCEKALASFMFHFGLG